MKESGSAKVAELPNPKERRAFARHALAHRTTIGFRSHRFEVTMDDVIASIGDISRSGLFVRCQDVEKPGTEILFWFGDPRVHADFVGKVCWSCDSSPRGPGMGIAIEGEPLEPQLIAMLLGGLG